MKRTIGIAALLLLIAAAALLMWMAAQGVPSDEERSQVYRVAFGHPAITERVGVVRKISVAPRQAAFFGKRRDDWKRVEASDAITGTVRLFIVGTTEGGFVTLSYRFREGDGTFTVLGLDTSALGTLPQSNSARE